MCGDGQAQLAPLALQQLPGELLWMVADEAKRHVPGAGVVLRMLHAGTGLLGPRSAGPPNAQCTVIGPGGVTLSNSSTLTPPPFGPQVFHRRGPWVQTPDRRGGGSLRWRATA